MLVLVPWLGPMGAALGLIAATLTVSLPANLRALGRETGTTPLAFLAFWKGWALRLAVAAGVRGHRGRGRGAGRLVGGWR